MNEHRITISKSAGRIVVAVLALFALAGMQTPWTAHAAPQVPQTGNWEQQAPYPTRFAINGVDMVTATEAWAVAYTDILHTTDGGVTWENQPRPGNENLYAVDFFDNQHGIAMGNTTLYTRNGGDTWTQGWAARLRRVEMADANLAFITDHRVAGYSRSTDGGATWTFRTMPSNITTIQCFDSLNCVAASPSGVYHSYDGGLNWSFVPGQGGEFVSTYFINHNQGWIVMETAPAAPPTEEPPGKPRRCRREAGYTTRCSPTRTTVGVWATTWCVPPMAGPPGKKYPCPRNRYPSGTWTSWTRSTASRAATAF